MCTFSLSPVLTIPLSLYHNRFSEFLHSLSHSLLSYSFIPGHCHHQFSSVRKKAILHIGLKHVTQGCLLHGDPLSLLHTVGHILVKYLHYVTH